MSPCSSSILALHFRVFRLGFFASAFREAFSCYIFRPMLNVLVPSHQPRDRESVTFLQSKICVYISQFFFSLLVFTLSPCKHLRPFSLETVYLFSSWVCVHICKCFLRNVFEKKRRKRRRTKKNWYLHGRLYLRVLTKLLYEIWWAVHIYKCIYICISMIIFKLFISFRFIIIIIISFNYNFGSIQADPQLYLGLICSCHRNRRHKQIKINVN